MYLFCTYDFVGHCEKVACKFTMQHTFVVSVPASACVIGASCAGGTVVLLALVPLVEQA